MLQALQRHEGRKGRGLRLQRVDCYKYAKSHRLTWDQEHEAVDIIGCCNIEMCGEGELADVGHNQLQST